MAIITRLILDFDIDDTGFVVEKLSLIVRIKQVDAGYRGSQFLTEYGVEERQPATARHCGHKSLLLGFSATKPGSY
jgi:hypothetical protein